eukprot:CAMPEP_0194536796 /NCGR_PEP_ID=MMETSP0253-20130528/75839_1 /TAXON_ID=2966 /ORGANISM="Noctiluca scintillans" /LENGTH=50 /DNA_ID=CAMNT_0039382753 /DNA_START=283 /DNA_END=432 /DNA_ORIENTATION=+
MDLDSFLKINAFCDSASVTMPGKRVMKLWRIRPTRICSSVCKRATWWRAR